MNQSPKRKRSTQKVIQTPIKSYKIYKDSIYHDYHEDDPEEDHPNQNNLKHHNFQFYSTNHQDENIFLKSPSNISKINNSSSTLYSGKTSNAESLIGSSFYSQDDQNALHSLTIKYQDTPYVRTPDLNESQVILDNSFVSEISSPPSPLNFDQGEKISPVRPENDPAIRFPANYSSNKSHLKSPLRLQNELNESLLCSPSILPQRSSSPTIKSEIEGRVKDKPLTIKIFDQYGAELVQDDYSSSCSSSGESQLQMGKNFEDTICHLTNSTKSLTSSSSVFQNDSEYPEYESLPNSTSRTLFCDESSNVFQLRDENQFSSDKHTGISKSHSYSLATPNRLLTNQNQHLLEQEDNQTNSVSTGLSSPFVRQRIRSLPPTFGQNISNELESESSPLLRSHSYNRVLTSASTPFKPHKKLDTPSSHIPRPKLSSTPDRLISRVTTTPPRHEHLQLPYQMLYSPPFSNHSSPLIINGVGFSSPSSKTAIEESWPGCKSLFDSPRTLTPPHLGTTPMRFPKNLEHPRELSNSAESLIHSTESNIGKRSRSPFSSLPSPTEMRLSQHQKFDTENKNGGKAIRPLPDQSVFEISNSQNQHSLICPPTPERNSFRLHTKSEEFNDNDIFLSRISDEENEFHSPRLYRQNSLEDNKILISSHHPSQSHLDHSQEIDDIEVETSGSSISTTNEFESQTPENIMFYRDFINEGLMGTGTFAEVYRVSLRSDPTQKYAIKKSKKKFKNKSERESLLNEVRIMQALEDVSSEVCPYILRFYNAWQEDSFFYVQLELAERGTLRDLMNLYADQNKMIPTPDILQIIFQIASGLKHIHACHIVHLDIKPQNILITTDGILKICDFGIAIIEGPNGDERHEGDTKYLPEELLNSPDRYYTADIFSFGLSIYDICLVPALDTLPYGGQTWHDIRAGIITDITLPIHGNRPKQLYNLILSCISANPAHRPSADIILANWLFTSSYFTASTKILCEPPIRAPSPVVYNPSLTVATDIQASTPLVTTPISHQGTSTWHQRMLSASPSYNTPADNVESILRYPNSTPFSLSHHSNRFLEDLALSEEPTTPTTFPLSQLYKTTPRQFSPSGNSFDEATSFPDKFSHSSTFQSNRRSLPNPGICLTIPTAPPTSYQESMSTPTSRTSRPPPIPSTPQPPPSTMKISRKGGKILKKK